MTESSMTRSRAEKNRWVSLLAISCLLLGACGKKGGTVEGDGSNPLPVFDIDTNLPAANGCLHLPTVFSLLQGLSTEAGLLRFTSDFEVRSAPGEKSEPRRNYVAIAAFANFKFRETDLHSAVAAQPPLEQDTCASVTFKSELEGDRTLKIKSSEPPNVAHLVSDDGAHLIYKLNGSRELEITRIATAIDFCPPYAKAEVKTKEILRWGPGATLSQGDFTVPRPFLKQISVAVTGMPEDLSKILMQDNSPTVSAAARDLSSLTSATLAPEVQDCPVQAKPPSGDEPPPTEGPVEGGPEGGPEPAPEPSPTPSAPEAQPAPPPPSAPVDPLPLPPLPFES